MTNLPRSASCSILVLLAATLAACTTLSRHGDPSLGRVWNSQILAKDGRIDAVAYLGDGVVIAGSRVLEPGHVYRSADAGVTWTETATIEDGEFLGNNITCVASGGKGLAYLLAGDTRVWKSTDWGRSWRKLERLAHHQRLEGYQYGYAMIVLDSGTVLVSDTNPAGGHVYRSENQGQTWTDIGPISNKPVYRFQKVADGVLINGWAGHVYKSTDDGRTWRDMGLLADTPLYATEYLGHGVALQASHSGHVFRSTDNGQTWTDIGKIGDAADDFVWLGGDRVVLTTYQGSRHMYLSEDQGLTWTDIGGVPTGLAEDWLDHVISFEWRGHQIAVGGTGHGCMLHSPIR